MSKTMTLPKTKVTPKTARPRLFKVILLNDDFTPREFVVTILRSVFRMRTEDALGVMLTAHQKGACVVAVYTRDIADTMARQGTEAGRTRGYPLTFTTERED